jgi:hypothetical protein
MKWRATVPCTTVNPLERIAILAQDQFELVSVSSRENEIVTIDVKQLMVLRHVPPPPALLALGNDPRGVGDGQLVQHVLHYGVL